MRVLEELCIQTTTGPAWVNFTVLQIKKKIQKLRDFFKESAHYKIFGIRSPIPSFDHKGALMGASKQATQTQLYTQTEGPCRVDLA